MTLCLWCEEPVDGLELPDDTRPLCEVLHPECFVRQFFGSVGHLTGRCSCNGGSEDDPPGMSRREAARAAAKLWREAREGS